MTSSVLKIHQLIIINQEQRKHLHLFVILTTLYKKENNFQSSFTKKKKRNENHRISLNNFPNKITNSILRVNIYKDEKDEN